MQDRPTYKMKVLWISHTPAGYSSPGSAYNGCGWISSLQAEMSSRICLAIAFPHKDGIAPKSAFSWSRQDIEGVRYYPVSDGFDRNRADRLKLLAAGDYVREKALLDTYVEIVDDFQPDLIEVFGTEHEYGLIAKYVSQPVAVHIQGILNPCFKAYLPEGMSWMEYFAKSSSPGQSFWRIYNYVKWKRACARENEIFNAVSNYMGRTQWDMEYVTSKNRKCRYFHIDEVLRPEFYQLGTQQVPSCGKLKLMSTISEAPYKGMDLILRAGKLLRQRFGDEFEWDVYGNVEPDLFCRFTKIRTEQAGVRLMGVANASEIAGALQDAAIYVHPSYIDNSPNSVCEAQMMGVPSVACNVGGVSSIISDGETGLLVQSGDAEEMAETVARLYSDRKMYSDISRNAMSMAAARHDKKKITDDLMDAYISISGK